MNIKIFITGGSGLLALNWALAFRDRYSVVLGLHKRIIAPAGTENWRVELDSADHLARAFESIQPQVVIHTAGLANVEECEVKPDLAQHINVDLAANVAQVCANLGLPLVHISTDHLFSGEASLVDETHPVAPINVYGRTKAEAELRVLEAHPQALVVRTNFYGWGPSYRRSFSDMVIEALRSGNNLTLFNDVFYTPILVETLAGAVHDLVSLKASGIFHVVGDERISKYEFGQKIAERFGLAPNVIESGSLTDHISQVQRPHDMSLSNRKTCALLGRKIGGVDDQVARLLEQERGGFAQEIRKL